MKLILFGQYTVFRFDMGEFDKVECHDMDSCQGVHWAHSDHYPPKRVKTSITNQSKGGRVEIRGLCSFFVKEYRSYTGRNPKTGEKVKIKPKKLPFFKAGKELKERVDR